MLSSYQRGFVAGTKHLAHTLAVHKDGALTIGVMQTPYRTFINELIELATHGRTTLGQPIPDDDGSEWTPEQLRYERERLTLMLDEADHIYRPKTDDAAERVAFERVPEGLREGLEMYLKDHIPPGSFMTAVLSNDLKGAMAQADHKSRAGLFDIVSYLYNWAPGHAWGDKKAIERWCLPTIPLLSPASLGEELEADPEGRIACPGCGGRHYLRSVRAMVCIPPQASTKVEHEVQYVWCGSRAIPLGIDGKELP